MDTAPPDHIGRDAKQPICAFTLIRTDNMIGFYDPYFAENSRTAVVAAKLIRAAIDIAVQEQFQHLALICDRAIEPVFRQHGFRKYGWLSWLYLSKTKMEKIIS